MYFRLAVLCAVGVLLFPVASRAAPVIACQKPVLNGKNFAMTCSYTHQSMPLTLVMRGTVRDDQHDLQTATAIPVEIDVQADGKVRQTLKMRSDGVWLSSLAKDAFESIDLSFDGYDDLKVWSATSAGPNNGYAFWLYNPASGTFERRKDLDDKLSGFDVSLDPAKKILSTSARASCCEWDIDTYRWAGSRLLQISDSASGELFTGDANPLGDVASIRTFIAAAGGLCATDTTFFDDAGRITKEVIETEGGPCDDAQDYRKTTKGIDKTLNGMKPRGNVTDDYRDGILLARTIVYDPPKKP